MSDLDKAFSAIPIGLKDDLLSSFANIVSNYIEHKWEPSELNGGKFCESCYSIIEGRLTGRYPVRAYKPRNMYAACIKLENEYPSADRSLRIQMPRTIAALYEIRNNRGVGHAGNEINPNEMDATAVLYMSKWLLAELVRVIGDIDMDVAQILVSNIMTRENLLIWQSKDGRNIRRVLKPSLSYKDQTILLLYEVDSAVDEDLRKWIECGRLSDYKRGALQPLHKSRLIDYDESRHIVHLLPPGAVRAEQLLNQISGI